MCGTWVGGPNSWELKQLPRLEPVCGFTMWCEEQRGFRVAASLTQQLPAPEQMSPKSGPRGVSEVFHDLVYDSLDDAPQRETSFRALDGGSHSV